MPSDSLSAHGVSFSYGRLPVLADVSLGIDAGESLALAGPNGSGKTTLLRLLSGSLIPVSGAITLFDRPLSSWPPRERAKTIAVVSQHLDPSLGLAVEDVVALGRSPYTGFYGGMGAADRRVVEDALRATDAGTFVGRSFAELSGGERQRVMLAAAIAQEPRFLLLDEPTVHLDIEHQFGLLELLVQLKRERGIAILAVMHDLNLAALYFDRVAILTDGHLRADGPTEQVLRETDLEALFSAPLRVVTHPDAHRPQVLIRPKR